MLIPAVAQKDEIEKYSDIMRYSKEMMFYNGCQEHGRIYIHTDYTEGNFQWAIVDKNKELVGYIAYRVDYFTSAVYSFGLIKFKDNPQAMAMGILEAIRHIKKINPIRIEFRAVADNPANDGYKQIIKLMSDYHKTWYHLHYTFRDEGGEYHDTILYELIKEKKDVY